MGEECELLAWCVVANVAREVPFGPGGVEIRRGTKHFSPGAKVWVLPAQWGDGGDQVFVVARHRGSRRYVRMVVPSRRLTGFRVQGVYSPAVLRELTRPWQPRGDRPVGLWKTKEQAERAVAWWSEPKLTVTFTDGRTLHSTGRMVPDPPPLEITEDGRTYYLAHFNANRAVYSSLPPPREDP